MLTPAILPSVQPSGVGADERKTMPNLRGVVAHRAGQAIVAHMTQFVHNNYVGPATM